MQRTRRAVSCTAVSWCCALATPRASAQQPASCAMVGLRVVATDTLVAEPPATHCPEGRLVVTGAPRKLPSLSGLYDPARTFVVSMALENSGTNPLALPVGMRGDSVTAVQHGRQLSVVYSERYHGLHSFGYFTNERPWTFRDREARTLAPGKRSAVQTIEVTVGPLAQGLRLWFNVDGMTHPPAPSGYHFGPAPRYDAPLPASVLRFVDSAGLPEIKDVRTVFRLDARGLVLFNVRFGPPLDCPSGCFYSSALGLQYGNAIGWLTMDDHSSAHHDDGYPVQEMAFPASAVDAYLLSPAFLDTLARVYDHVNLSVVWTLRDYIARDPRVPRATLVRHVERLYETPDWAFAKLLVGLPRVQDDVELLTLLAYLPYSFDLGEAAYRLQTLAPRLVRDSSTSARTLFLIARGIRPDAHPELFRLLLEHPQVRANVAILAELAHHNADVRGRLLAVVRASPRVRAALSDYMKTTDEVAASRMGMRLLADPEAGTNEDVLLVLTNFSYGHALTEEVRASASRRLPERALRRDDFTYHPFR